MAIEIKNELRAAAIVSIDDGEKVIQIFGMTFVRTGVGVYVFTMNPEADADPSQLSIWCTTGINELTLPRGRFTDPKTLEVRSYLPDGTPADCRVLFVEVHRYPGVLGNTLPNAPPIPTPGGGGGGLVWNASIIAGGPPFQGVSGILYPWDSAGSPADMLMPQAPANNDLIGVKNMSTSEVNAFGFSSAAHAVEDPDNGAAAPSGFYLAGSPDGAFGGSLALVIWRFLSLTNRWYIMHAAKRGSAEVLAPP